MLRFLGWMGSNGELPKMLHLMQAMGSGPILWKHCVINSSVKRAKKNATCEYTLMAFHINEDRYEIDLWLQLYHVESSKGDRSLNGHCIHFHDRVPSPEEVSPCMWMIHKTRKKLAAYRKAACQKESLVDKNWQVIALVLTTAGPSCSGASVCCKTSRASSGRPSCCCRADSVRRAPEQEFYDTEQKRETVQYEFQVPLFTIGFANEGFTMEVDILSKFPFKKGFCFKRKREALRRDGFLASNL